MSRMAKKKLHRECILDKLKKKSKKARIVVILTWTKNELSTSVKRIIVTQFDLNCLSDNLTAGGTLHFYFFFFFKKELFSLAASATQRTLPIPHHTPQWDPLLSLFLSIYTFLNILLFSHVTDTFRYHTSSADQDILLSHYLPPRVTNVDEQTTTPFPSFSRLWRLPLTSYHSDIILLCNDYKYAMCHVLLYLYQIVYMIVLDCKSIASFPFYLSF